MNLNVFYEKLEHGCVVGLGTIGVMQRKIAK
jgi:hypothetical protein